jgi:integrase
MTPSPLLSWKEAVQRALQLNPAALKEQERTARHTLDDVAAKYFAHRRARARSQDGLEQDELRWRVYIKPKLGTDDVAALTTAELERWLDAMVTDAEAKAKEKDSEDDAARRERQRKARGTANRIWTILRAILNYGFKHQYAPSDAPWRQVKPFKGVGKPRKVFLSQAEAFALLKVLDAEFVPLAKGALYTGLRLGEILAMRVVDVKGGQVHVPPRKTDDARDVPLNKEGAAFFASLTKDQPDDALVFGIDDTKAMRVQLGRKLRKAFQAAGVKPIVFHDLRRSYGSLMLGHGASMDQIRVLLGHTDLRMTSSTYGHLDQKNLANAVNKTLPSFDENAPAKKKRARKKRARS